MLRHARSLASRSVTVANNSSLRALSTGVRKTVTLFPGDGIGPEISKAVCNVFEAAGVAIDWDPYVVDPARPDPRTNSCIPLEALESVRKHKVGLKGPLATPIGKGHMSNNLALRKSLNLYANVRPCKSIPGLKTAYDNVDLVIIRENTEGEYSGLEHEVSPGVVESLKVITKTASQRVCQFAFDYARANKRSTVHVVHKASVMSLSDGLFLRCAEKVADKFSDISFVPITVDNAALELARDPSKFEVLVMPNLYGDIVSDLCAGLVGGLGLTPSGNIGEDASVFEAVHGTAPDIAGQNKGNPTALLLSGCMMLRHMELTDAADRIETAALTVIGEGKWTTADLGGSASTTEYTSAICDRL